MKANDKLLGLDHLRTLAITMVFVFHYGRIFPHPAWTNTYSKFGWTGVDLFFVLSGFLIASQLFAKIQQNQNVLLKEFFIKRFFRIIPAYLFVVVLYFCFPYIREREALAPLWKYLTFTQNILLDLSSQGTFSHAWSLCIEEQFYLFFPLVLVALLYFKVFQKAYWLLILIFLSGFFIRYFSYQTFVAPHLYDENAWTYWYQWIYYPTFCRLDGLLMGIGLAAMLEFAPNLSLKFKKYGNMSILLGLLLLLVAYYICIDEETLEASVFGYPLIAFGYGWMVLGAVQKSSFLSKFSSSIAAKIATLSYSIYLSHKFVIHVTQELLFLVGIDKKSNLMFFICIISAVVFAYLMNILIEKPFLKWRDKVLERF